jgi:hypothetical protein
MKKMKILTRPIKFFSIAVVSAMSVLKPSGLVQAAKGTDSDSLGKAGFAGAHASSDASLDGAGCDVIGIRG